MEAGGRRGGECDSAGEKPEVRRLLKEKQNRGGLHGRAGERGALSTLLSEANKCTHMSTRAHAHTSVTIKGLLPDTDR